MRISYPKTVPSRARTLEVQLANAEAFEGVERHVRPRHVDDRLEERGNPFPADDVAQLAGELPLALLLLVTDRIGRDLHPVVDLALEADRRPVFDAHHADEEADLCLLHGREALPHRIEELLPQLVSGRVERRLARPLPRLEEDEEARPAHDVRGHHSFRKPRRCLGGHDLGRAAEEFVEERPAVLRLDRLELLDVDEDDADLSLIDEHFLQAAEHHGHGRKAGGAIEEHVLAHARGSLGRRSGAAMAVEQRADALDHLVAVEGLDQIVVRAELQSGEAVLHVAARGGEDHRDVRRPLHRLEGLADLPATLFGHHHIEQNDVGKSLLRDGQRLLAIAGGEDLAVERPQKQPQQSDDVIVVVCDQEDRTVAHCVLILAHCAPKAQGNVLRPRPA